MAAIVIHTPVPPFSDSVSVTAPGNHALWRDTPVSVPSTPTLQHPILPSTPDVAINTRCCRQHQMLLSAPDSHRSYRQPQLHLRVSPLPPSPEVRQVTQTSATSWLQNLRALTDILRIPLQNRTSIQHYRHYHRKSATGAAVFRGLRLLQTASPASDILRTTIQEHFWLRLSHPGLQSVGVLRPPPALHCGLHYAVRAYITQG